MIERTAKNVALHPLRLLGDSAYGLADMLGFEPHVTVFDKSARKDGTFAREDFKYERIHSLMDTAGHLSFLLRP